MFELGKRYNFTTISNTVLNGSYSNLKTIIPATVFNVAKNFGIDLATVREKLVSETGLNLLSVFEATYVVFEDDDGNYLVFAYDWINQDSILAVDAVNINITVKNTTTGDLENLKALLSGMGYTFDISVESV